MLGSATSVQVPPVASAIVRSGAPASHEFAAPPPMPKVRILVPAVIASCSGDPAPVVNAVGIPSEMKKPVLISVAGCVATLVPGSGVTAAILALAQSIVRNGDAAVSDGLWSEWGLPASNPPVDAG